MANSKADLWFDPKPEVKCIHCGKAKGHHLAKTYHCPVGAKHRIMGYTQFHSTNVFSPKPMRISEDQLRKSERGVLFAFLESHGEVVARYLTRVQMLNRAIKVRDEYMARPKSVE